MTENEYDTYYDINIPELDISFLQEQVTKIVATTFVLIVAGIEIFSYFKDPQGEPGGDTQRKESEETIGSPVTP
jgi:hypothetical protein